MKAANAGFSLIELMVVLSMASIVLAFAVPSFHGIVQDGRVTTSANELVGALNLARSEAIKRRVTITVCKSSDGAACATSGDWAQGWIVFTDQNKNESYESESETLLQVQSALDEGDVTITGGDGTSNLISYVASGRSKSAGGTVTVCDDRGDSAAKAVVVNRAGRIRVQNGTGCS